MRTSADLAEKLNMDVTDLMRQCNGKVSAAKALVKGLAKELAIDESYLNRLAKRFGGILGRLVARSSLCRWRHKTSSQLRASPYCAISVSLSLVAAFNVRIWRKIG